MKNYRTREEIVREHLFEPTEKANEECTKWIDGDIRVYYPIRVSKEFAKILRDFVPKQVEMLDGEPHYLRTEFNQPTMVDYPIAEAAKRMEREYNEKSN